LRAFLFSVDRFQLTVDCFLMLISHLNLPDALENATWVVGVSGGADSLALLHALAAQMPPERLIVAHLNHGWRVEADDDAEFVRKTAVSLNLTPHIQNIDPSTPATEEAARNARYHFFADIARQTGATVVAVAHNADDQAETVLMRLLRGTGTAGLRGMQPIGSLPIDGTDELTLVRPLLTVSRTQTEAYWVQQRLSPRQDVTNSDTTFLRNRIRHDLLPLLAEYNPQIKSRLQQTAVIATADYALLQTLAASAWAEIGVQQGDGWLSFSRELWEKRPLSIRRILLRQAAAELRPELPNASFDLFEQARLLIEGGQTGAQADLSADLRLTISYDRVQLTVEGATIPHRAPQLLADEPIALSTNGRFALADGWELVVEQRTRTGNLGRWELEIANPSPPLFLRSRVAGERFQPFGLNGRSQSIKKAMINHKIEARLRARWPIIATKTHPLWIAGCCQDERSRLPKDTDMVIHLQFIQTP